MTIRDVEIVAKTGGRGRAAVWLCRIRTDPAPDNYALWDFASGSWSERRMSARSARTWAAEHNLTLTIGE